MEYQNGVRFFDCFRLYRECVIFCPVNVSAFDGESFGKGFPEKVECFPRIIGLKNCGIFSPRKFQQSLVGKQGFACCVPLVLEHVLGAFQGV